jgi:DNA-binding GntR family transcriptional regulator
MIKRGHTCSDCIRSPTSEAKSFTRAPTRLICSARTHVINVAEIVPDDESVAKALQLEGGDTSL